MGKSLFSKFSLPLMIPATVFTVGVNMLSAAAQPEAIYSPVPLAAGSEVTDVLSESDIPTGYGGFYRDYTVTFAEGDMVLMDLRSEEFDTIIALIAPDGRTIGENDDGPDGTTNSLLFTRIVQAGDYIVRVSPYAGQGMGTFTLNVIRLQPVDE
ncbi:peptidase [filamentous cyanobacterium CCP1]|nr:peptidase [filamentous cyanobacterium CCP1]PSN20020.1 peptidase [filamentous cyanobacterium CCP5]